VRKFSNLSQAKSMPSCCTVLCVRMTSAVDPSPRSPIVDRPRLEWALSLPPVSTRTTDKSITSCHCLCSRLPIQQSLQTRHKATRSHPIPFWPQWRITYPRTLGTSTLFMSPPGAVNETILSNLRALWGNPGIYLSPPFPASW